MITEATHLAAIRERPDDPGPRLVFADWLEEQGEVERAKFVRLGLEFDGLSEVDEPRWKEGTCQCEGCVICRRQIDLFATVHQHRVSCRKCVGGAVPNHHAMGRCRECNGEGFTIVEKMNGQAWFADALGGEIGVKCEQCDGKKKFALYKPGTSRSMKTHDCSQCDGSGRVVKDLTVRVPWDRVSDDREMSKHSIIPYTVSGGCLIRVACTLAQFVGKPCERCRGEGIAAPYTDAECPDCYGTGYVGGIARPLFERFAVPMDGVTLTDRQPVIIGNDAGEAMFNWMAGRDALPEPESPHFIGPLLYSMLDLPVSEVGGERMAAKFAATAELADAALRLAAWKFGRQCALTKELQCST